jgi:hypothetical protein
LGDWGTTEGIGLASAGTALEEEVEEDKRAKAGRRRARRVESMAEGGVGVGNYQNRAADEKGNTGVLEGSG